MSQLQLSSSVSSLPQLAYKGTPVVTTETLAKVYDVALHQVRQNFKNNKERFVEGKHYFLVSGNNLREFKNRVENFYSVKIAQNVNALTLWTERGAARHAKMLNSDKAWDMFELLEETFFRVANQPRTASNATPSTVEGRKPLEKLLKVWATRSGLHNAQCWTMLNAAFNLSSVTELPEEWIPDAIAWVQAKIDALPRALLQAQAQHLFDRMELTGWEKINMGPHIREMLENEKEAGPRLMEAVILKARYINALGDVIRLSQDLSADLRKESLTSDLLRVVNKTGTFSDSFVETLTFDTRRLTELGQEFHSTACRALNTRICLAKMLNL